MTVVSSLQLSDISGELSSFSFLVRIVGISFSGVFLGRVISKYQGFLLGFFGPLISFVLTLLLLMIQSPNLILTIVFLMSAITGLDNPNNNTSISRLFPDRKTKAHIFTRQQTIVQSVSFLGPIVSSGIILFTNHNISYIFFAAMFLVSSVPWIFLKSYLKKVKRTSEVSRIIPKYFNGFRIIFSDKTIRKFSISRLLNNVVYFGALTIFPILVASLFKDNESFTMVQTISRSFVSGGFIMCGIIFGPIFKKSPLLLCSLTNFVPIIGIFSLVVPTVFGLSAITLFFMSLLLGIGQFVFRVSGMTLGQAITPEDHLGEVILAGDTIIRGFSASYGAGLLYLTRFVIGREIQYFLGLSLVSLLAPLFLQSAIAQYISGLGHCDEGKNEKEL